MATNGEFIATVPWDGSKTAIANYRHAVQAFCAKMEWTGHLQGGSTKDGMVWTFEDQNSQVIV